MKRSGIEGLIILRNFDRRDFDQDAVEWEVDVVELFTTHAACLGEMKIRELALVGEGISVVSNGGQLAGRLGKKQIKRHI